MILYVLANKLTTAANAIFLQSTAPFYILLLSPLLLGERSRRQDVGFMVAMVVGMSLILADEVAKDSKVEDIGTQGTE